MQRQSSQIVTVAITVFLLVAMSGTVIATSEVSSYDSARTAQLSEDDTSTKTDQFDPNSEDNPASIEGGTYSDLYVSSSDWYKLSSKSYRTTVTASIDPRQDNSDFGIGIWYKDQNDEWQGDKSTTETGDASATVKDIPANTPVYLQVGATEETYYELDVSTSQSVDSFTTDPYEPNDEFANAASIDPGTYNSLEAPGDDLDWYEIESGWDGDTIRASIDPEQENGNFYVGVWYEDQNGNWKEDISSTDNDDGIATLNNIPSNTPVYVAVTEAEGVGETDYSLTVSAEHERTQTDEFEPNNEFANAASIEEGEYSDLYVKRGEPDWFKLTSAPTDASANVDPVGDTEVLAVKITYKDENGEWVSDTSRTDTGKGAVVMRDIPVSVHDVYVAVYAEDEGRYELSVTSDTSITGQYEPNNKYTNAEPLNTNTNDRDIFAQVSGDNPDWYKLENVGSRAGATIDAAGGRGKGNLAIQITYKDENGEWVSDTSRTDAGDGTVELDDIPRNTPVYVAVYAKEGTKEQYSLYYAG